MKIIKILFTVALGTFAFGSFAQNENALLYKVSGNGITKPSYIFGTIHISCDVKFDAATTKALDETTQLYLELDMDDSELQNKIMKSLSMKNGVTISSLVSPEDYRLLDDYFLQKMNVPISAVNTYKPFFLSSLFLNTLLDCTPQSYENELVKVSSFQNEPVFGLETVAEQMDIFDQIPYQLQVDELITSVRNDFRDDKKELNILLKTYATKDLNELSKVSSSSKSTIMTDYEDLLLNNRNKKWLKLIEQITKNTPTFFAVGAAHLSGDEGLIQLLRTNGYLVEAL